MVSDLVLQKSVVTEVETIEGNRKVLEEKPEIKMRDSAGGSV